MSKPLNVMLIEDSEDDALLLIRELRRGGYEPAFERVETPEFMRAALERRQWDLIISDYVLPKFSGMAALAMLKESGTDLPFIIVSGNIGEDIAVGAMKAGAHDYILKGNMTRLVPAVERELREARIRRERRQAHDALTEQSKTLEAFFTHSINPLVFLDKDFNFLRVNQAYAQACGRDVAEFPGHNHFEFYPDKENEAIFRGVVETKVPFQTFARPFVFPDHPEWGVTYWDWSLVPVLEETGEADFLVFSLKDVTLSKRAEDALRAAAVYNRNLIEASLDPLVTIDVSGKITDVNLATERITGYSRSELIGTDFSDYFSEPERARVGHRKVFEEGVVHNYFLEIRDREGAMTPVLYNASIYRNETGDVIGAFAAARDITERREAENRVNATNALLKLFSQSLSRREYLDAVVEHFREWCKCRCVGIRLLDDRGNIPYESYTGFSREFWESENLLSIKKDQCACIRVISEKPEPQDAPVMTELGSFFSGNTVKFVGELTEEEKTRFRGACLRSGFLTVAIIPIRHYGEVFGAIHLADEREGRIPPKTLEFLEMTSPLIGEALYRFSIEEKLERNNEELRNLSLHLQTALEKERTNVARDIHDELGQILTALKMDLSWLADKYTDHKILSKKTKAMIEIVNATIKTVKRICSQLRPGLLDDLGLTAAIEWHAEEFQARSGIACDVTFIPDNIILDRDRSIAVFRIFQETLTNVLRHAEATEVRAVFEQKDHDIVICIEDNGRGISERQITNPHSFGLIGMRERVLSFGGNFEILGVRNQGTAIRIVIPLGPRADDSAPEPAL